MRKPRAKPWPLADVYRASHAAPVVWLALLDLADKRGTPVVTPTREGLAKATGIDRHKSISRALTALEQAGWIDRRHVPVGKGGRQVATLLRIVLRRRGRKTPHTGRNALGAKSALYGAKAVEGEKRPNFPTGRGRARPPPLPASRGAAARPADACSEHPSARIERERLATIRAAREAETRQGERQALQAELTK
ncbi:MAG: helix-turn-helix domain-containing protein [Planctomycetota bacterium]